MADLGTIPAVELAAVGEFSGLLGRFRLTRDDLDSAIAASRSGEFREPRIKLGHTDPRFDGTPAFGRVRNLRLSGDGMKLLGDYVGVPVWLSKGIASAYPSRSIEGRFNARSPGGSRFRFVLDAVALLGTEAPAIDTIEDLQLVMEEGAAVAASHGGRQVFAVFTPETRSDSGHEPAGGNMDCKAMIEILGLSEDATDDEILAAARKAREAMDSLDAGDGDEDKDGDGGGDGSGDGEGEGDEGDEGEGKGEGAPADSTVTIDAEQYRQLQSAAEQGVAARRRQLDEDRDRELEQAVLAGKFPASRVDHYRRLWDADEDGTREVLAGLAPNTIPVSELGETPDPVLAGKGGDDLYPSDWLSAAERARLTKEG